MPEIVYHVNSKYHFVPKTRMWYFRRCNNRGNSRKAVFDEGKWRMDGGEEGKEGENGTEWSKEERVGPSLLY